MNDLRARLEAAGLPSEDAIAATRCVEAIGINHVGAYVVDAQAIAKVYVAARLAEMGGLMFGRFCGTIAEMHKRNAAVSEAVSALMSVLFPETTP